MAAMIPVLVCLALGLSPLLLIGLNRLNLRYGVLWLSAILITFGSWLAVLWLAWQLPVRTSWGIWTSQAGLFGGPDWFFVDSISWPLAFSVITVTTAALLTGLMEEPLGDGLAGLITIQLFSAAALAAVFAGSIPGLLIAWLVMDVIEMVSRLAIYSQDRAGSERAINAFSTKILGAYLALLGLGLSRVSNISLAAPPQQSAGWLLLASGFRVGTLPVRPPLEIGRAIGQGERAVFRLAPIGGAVAVCARASAAGLPEGWIGGLLALVLFAGLFGAINWLTRDGADASPYWTIGMASLALAAALQSEPEAAVIWGVSLLIGGGLFLLRKPFSLNLFWLVAPASALLFGLPFSPSWGGSFLMSHGSLVWGATSSLIAGLMLAGCIKHARHAQPAGDFPMRGAQVFYIAGMVLLVAVMFLAGWVPLLLGTQRMGSWWPGFLIAGIVAVLVFTTVSRSAEPIDRLQRAIGVISPELLVRSFRRSYRLVGRGAIILSKVLEGRSAVLWAILVLALLVSVFAQIGLGS